jgi:hypothetical protein
MSEAVRALARGLLLAAALASSVACSGPDQAGPREASPERPAAPSGSAPAIEPNLQELTRAAAERCNEVRGRRDTYRKVERDLTGLSGLSAEGGELVAWMDVDRPAFINATAYGETGRAEYQLCYGETGELLVFRSEESRYEEPMGKVAETRVERYFFHDGKLIHWSLGDRPPAAQTLTAEAGARAAELLELSRTFAEAARSPAPPG